MTRGGLDPFVDPERVHIVGPPADEQAPAMASWSYPAVEQIEVAVDEFDGRAVDRRDLVVLAVDLETIGSALDRLEGGDTEAVLIPTWPSRPHSRDHPRGESAAAIAETVRAAILASSVRVMGPGAGVTISQDGGRIATVADDPVLASTVAERAEWQGTSIGPLIGVGTGVDVTLGEVAGTLAESETIDLVVGQTERIDSRFVGDIRATADQTPIAVQPAAGPPHQAADAVVPGSRVSGSLLEEAGVVPVDTLERMVEGAPALAGQSSPDPGSVVVVSNAGGPGVMAIDAVGESGLDVARMADSTIETLERVVPAHGSARNPLDLLADSDIEVFETVLDAALQDPNVGSAVVISAPNPLFTFEDLARIIAAAASRHDAPVVTALMGGERTKPAAEILREAGIPNYFDPYRAVGALDLLWSHGEVIGNRTRGDVDTVEIEDGFVDTLDTDGHTRLEGQEAGDAVAGLCGEDCVQAHGGGDEIRLQISGGRTPARGPLVSLADAEFLAAVGDISVRAAPLSRTDAQSMLAELQAAPRFEGVRGQSGIAMAPIIELLHGVAALLVRRPRVHEITFPGLHATESGLVVGAVEIETSGRPVDPMARG